MPRLSHREYFLQMLEAVSARSTCRRRKVGAILVDRDNKILATGYNGVPRNMAHCIDHPCEGANMPPGARCMAIHAEQNALLQCSDMRAIHTLYVSTTPCFECARLLANTPLQRVIALTKYVEIPSYTKVENPRPMYVQDYQWSGIDVLGDAGITIEIG